MHNAIVVITNALGVYGGSVNLLKVLAVPLFNIVEENVDILISVWPRVLMPETDGVANFVHNCGEFETAFGERDSLFSIVEVANV